MKNLRRVAFSSKTPLQGAKRAYPKAIVTPVDYKVDEKLTQAKNPSKGYKDTLAKAQKFDHEMYGKLKPVERIMMGAGKPEDYPDLKDPIALVEMINEIARPSDVQLQNYNHRAEPVVVTVTGAAGRIAYSLLPRILSGEMLGPNQPIILNLLEIPQSAEALEGVRMELEDLAFPLMEKIVCTTDPKVAFDRCDFALMVGSKPRTKGMERGDLLRENAKIFQEAGQVINERANQNCIVTVVGNPANTNAMILSANAGDLPTDQVTALTRLDHNRGMAQLAKKLNVPLTDIHQFMIWGNHSATQYPDVSYVKIGNGRGSWGLSELETEWVRGEFQSTVQKRGAEIIESMGLSSATSAADATIKHVKDLVEGNKEWVSMAVCSDGSYGVPSDIWSSFPIVCNGAGRWGIVQGLPISEFSANSINASIDELLEEKKAVADLLPVRKHRLTRADKNLIYSPEFLIEHSHPDKILGSTENHLNPETVPQKIKETKEE